MSKFMQFYLQQNQYYLFYTQFVSRTNKRIRSEHKTFVTELKEIKVYNHFNEMYDHSTTSYNKNIRVDINFNVLMTGYGRCLYSTTEFALLLTRPLYR